MKTKIIETFPNGATIERHSVYGYLVRLNGKVVTFSKRIKTARDAARVAQLIPEGQYFGTQMPKEAGQ
jgi:hypothetical protein